MNTQILKLLWHKKEKQFFFFIEILIIFFVITMTFLYGYDHLKNYFVKLGYETKNQYIVRADFNSFKDSVELVRIKKLLSQEIKQIDGVESVAWVAGSAPMTYNNWGFGNDDLGFRYHANFLGADKNIVSALELNIVKGRGFEQDDYNDKYIPIIMNKLLYNLLVKAKGHEMVDSIYTAFTEFHIVGVVDHYKQNSEFQKEGYYLIALDHPLFLDNIDGGLTNLLIKVKDGANPSFQSKISSTYGDVAKIHDIYINQLDEDRKHESASYWLQLIAIGIIALFLLINISLGLIGILSHNISQRKSEIGLRKALGATTSQVVRQFVGEVMLVAGAALLVGLMVILQLPYVTEFEFEKKDLFIATALSLTFIIILLLLSSIVPSLRGARIEPSTALHEE